MSTYAHNKPGRCRQPSRWLRVPLSRSKDAAGKNRTSTTLSVIVPAYNEQYLIEASLQALAVLDESPRLQRINVIVVDDCSTDATAEAIRRFQAHLESSAGFQEIQLGLAAARKEHGQGRGHSHRARLTWIRIWW